MIWRSSGEVRIAEARNRVRELQKSRGYQVSRRLRSEHIFAEANSCHGMERARVRGCRRLQVQTELAGAVQNLMRLVSFRSRRHRGAAQAALPQGTPGTLHGPLGRNFCTAVGSRGSQSGVPLIVPRRCQTHPLKTSLSSTAF